MADEIDLAQEREHIATNSAVNDVRAKASAAPDCCTSAVATENKK